MDEYSEDLSDDIGNEKQLILKICSNNALVSKRAISEKYIIQYYIFERLFKFFDKDYFTFLKLYTKDLKVRSQTTLSKLNHYLNYKENAIIPSTLTLLI